MEHDLVVEGWVVLPGALEDVQVGISEGRIAEVKKQGLRGGKVIRAGSSLVFPGFVDSHVHLREPGWEHKEDFRTGTLAAVHGGVTTLLDMPNNPTPTTSVAAIEEKGRLASKALVDVRFFAGVVGTNISAIGSLKERAIGFKAYIGKSTGGLLISYDELRAALPEVTATRKPLSLHCEDQGIIDARAKEMAGSTAPDAYCDIRPPMSEIESVKIVAEIATKVRGSRVNICHASTAQTLRIVEESARKGMDFRCEATLHHVFFSRKAMLTNGLLRTNPPLRREEDRQALIDGLASGRIGSLVTDHAPHTRVEKVKEGLAGVPGLDDYGHIVSWLLKTVGIDPLTVSRVCSSNSTDYFGLTDRGEVAEGKRADITILDLKSPEKVSSERLMTKCGWSPYEGVEFPGRVRWTIHRGKVLLDDFELVT